MQELLQQTADILNKKYGAISDRWYSVKDGQLRWDNDHCGGPLSQDAIFDLLGSGSEPIKFFQSVSRNNEQRV